MFWSQHHGHDDEDQFLCFSKDLVEHRSPFFFENLCQESRAGIEKEFRGSTQLPPGPGNEEGNLSLQLA